MENEIRPGIKVKDTMTGDIGTVITTAILYYNLKISSVQVETIDEIGNKTRKWLPIERIEVEK